MKVAVTADIHLKTGNDYPERLNALKNILDSLLKDGIGALVIAGDLFDIESQNYSVFDSMCREGKNSGINFYVISGNHDPAISPKHFTSPNIKILAEPEIINLNDNLPVFFFLPYMPGKSMGEVLAKFKQALPERWILIGHGDYLSGTKIPNTYEAGVYMPLGRSDIEYYNPSMVILGHIHKKMKAGKVHYPGSPCGMDINETGRRSFIVIDSNDMSVTERNVDSDYLFFSENLLTLPTANEFEDIKARIGGIISSWKLNDAEVSRARIRLKVRGYTSDKNRLASVIKQSFASFKFYDGKGPDMEEVFIFNDPDRIGIVERVREMIESLDEQDGYCREKKDLILEQALSLILKE